jgi:hypothetical protein
MALRRFKEMTDPGLLLAAMAQHGQIKADTGSMPMRRNI